MKVPQKRRGPAKVPQHNYPFLLALRNLRDLAGPFPMPDARRTQFFPKALGKYCLRVRKKGPEGTRRSRRSRKRHDFNGLECGTSTEGPAEVPKAGQVVGLGFQVLALAQVLCFVAGCKFVS